MEIRLLFDHRDGLVRERTRFQNRVRWHLLALNPELEAKLRSGALSDLRQLERLDGRLRRIGTGARVRVAREQVAQIRRLTREADELERELLELIGAYRPRLLEEQGCGALTAALLIGRTAGAQRFRSDACFGRQSGTAPIPCSSGQRTQHRLDRGGDRQLNRALHTIAITRAQHDPATKEYLARKQAEGKTKKGALRCLKRYLARRFWRLLAEPPLEPETSRLRRAHQRAGRASAAHERAGRARAPRHPRTPNSPSRGRPHDHRSDPDALHHLAASSPLPSHPPPQPPLRPAAARGENRRATTPAANRRNTGPTAAPTDANQRVLRRPAALDQRAATHHTPRSAPIADSHPVQPPSPTHSETRK
jgi:hypothetical protein